MDGIPLTCEVFEGNTKDSTTVQKKITEIKSRFGCTKACFVGDRGMRTNANIDKIKNDGLDFIIALKHQEVVNLVKKQGVVQLTLFDEKNIADILIDGRRLIACHNPIAGADTKRRRNELLKLIEKELDKIKGRVEKGRLQRPEAIQKTCDKVFSKYKMEKFYILQIEAGSFSWSRKEDEIKVAAQLDGVYVIESTLSKDEMPPEKAQQVYKNLQQVERAFRCLKSELNIRPMRHWLEKRIKGHVFLSVLSYLVEQTWRNILLNLPDEDKPEWQYFLAQIKAWQQVDIPQASQLKPKFANFSTDIAKFANLLNIPLP